METATRVGGIRRPHAAPVMAGVLMATGCVALALVDPAGGPPICPFKAMTGLDCPGCGGTRAVHQLLNGHLMAALDLNVLAVLVLPLLAWAAFIGLTRGFGGPSWPMLRVSRNWLVGALVVVIAFGVVRNLPVPPFSWLGTGT